MSQIVRQISWSRIKLIGHIFAPFDTKQILCEAKACLSLCDNNQMLCKNFCLCFFCRAMMYRIVLKHGFQRNFRRMCKNLLWEWTFVVNLYSGMKVGHGDRIFWQNFEVVYNQYNLTCYRSLHDGRAGVQKYLIHETLISIRGENGPRLWTQKRRKLQARNKMLKKWTLSRNVI